MDASVAAARSAGPAADAQPLVGGRVDADWDELPERTTIGVFVGVAAALGEAYRATAATGDLLFG